MEVKDFYYNLPEELIAQDPLEKRDESRFMVIHRDTGEIEHRKFHDIIEYLNPGAPRCCRHDLGIGVGCQEVVSVNEREAVACRCVDAGVAGVAQSAVWLVDDAYAAVFQSPFVAQLWAVVGRAVVDEDHLQVVIALLQNALHAAFQRALRAVDGNDN